MGRNVADSSLFTLNKSSFGSFPRKRESTLFMTFRTRAFAGVTAQSNRQSITPAPLSLGQEGAGMGQWHSFPVELPAHTMNAAL